MTKKRIFFGALIFLQFNKTVILIRRISVQHESRVVDVKNFFRNLIVYIAQTLHFNRHIIKIFSLKAVAHHGRRAYFPRYERRIVFCHFLFLQFYCRYALLSQKRKRKY